MKKKINAGFIAMITVGWWGLMYPEFCMTDEMVQVICAGQTENVPAQKAIFELLNSDGDQIIIKSKILEYIEAVLDQS